MMYAMIRRYRMAVGSIDDLMHKVDTQFADRLREQLSIIQYLAIDTDDGTIMTITVFEDEEAGHHSAATSACCSTVGAIFKLLVESRGEWTARAKDSSPAFRVIRL